MILKPNPHPKPNRTETEPASSDPGLKLAEVYGRVYSIGILLESKKVCSWNRVGRVGTGVSLAGSRFGCCFDAACWSCGW